MIGVAERRPGLSKKQKFFLIILVLGLLSLALSFVAKVTVVETDEGDFLHLGVIGPMSGAQAGIGESLRQGAELYVSVVNEQGRLGGRKLSLEVFDDGGRPDRARTEAEKAAGANILGILGHWDAEAAQAAAPVYAQAGVPVVLPSSLTSEGVDGGQWSFSTVFEQEHQARFLANYARNVLGHKLMSIVTDEPRYGVTLAEPFEATYRRFGTAIRYTWRFDSTAPSAEQDLERIVAELAERKDAGALFLAVDAREGAKLLRLIRDARLKNLIIAASPLTTAAFLDAMKAEIPSATPTARYTDGLLVASPLIFDTANEQAQTFATRYRAAYGRAPDWVAAYAYEAAHLLISGLDTEALDQDLLGTLGDMRAKVRDRLATAGVGEGIPGVAGVRAFDAAGGSTTPVLIGIYNGSNMISALTQLQPITSAGRTNYIEELRKGKVLYVNDRFMYRTNVVYTGLDLKEVSNLSVDDNTVDLEFVVWFRYRGDFEPNDVEFINALEPISLEEPIDEQTIGDMTYRAYRASGTFQLNFTRTQRFYGSHVLGVSLMHRKLNRNNLLYVVDVLGMNLESGGTVLERIETQQALNPNLGWSPLRAWVSQDIARKSTHGDPAYVGFTASPPEFSRIDLGLLIKPSVVQARDFVPSEYFLYVGIFGLLGSLFAVWMDRRSRRRFWHLQSWGLRLVSWPLLLLAVGNLGLDAAFRTLETYYIDIFVMVYDMLWWVVPARLFGLALERFVWLPLEEHTGRTIPNVVRVFATITVYSLAIFGIIAFVFDQKITSLLATSGLLAMIIGLAIQANISNVFSGIVLNIERPFNVGDWVKIGDLDEGQITDITWRTTRIRTRSGYVISLPNGQVSESQVHNYDSGNVVRLEIDVEVDARYNHDVVDEIMTQTSEKLPFVVQDPAPEVRFQGMVWFYNGWVAKYEVQIWIEDYGTREEVEEAVYTTVWDELIKAKIFPSPDTIERGFLPKWDGTDRRASPAQ